MLVKIFYLIVLPLLLGVLLPGTLEVHRRLPDNMQGSSEKLFQPPVEIQSCPSWLLMKTNFDKDCFHRQLQRWNMALLC